MRRCYLVLIGLVLSAPQLVGAEPDVKGIEFFEKKIRPVLVDQCYSCHSAEAKKRKGGLALDTSADLLKGGETGPALKPGKPDESLIFQALTHEGDLKMPPKAPLSAAVQADFKTWIAMGAPDPRQGGVKPVGIDWNEAQALVVSAHKQTAHSGRTKQILAKDGPRPLRSGKARERKTAAGAGC